MSWITACVQKVKYPSRVAAQRARASMQRKLKRDDGRPYRCRYGCGGWHLGHRL